MFLNLPEVASLLLQHGANPNTVDASHDTPFLLMCKTGNSRMVRVLLEAGANVEAGDQEGNTGLHYAILAGHRDVVNVLLRKGATTHRKTQYVNLT